MKKKNYFSPYFNIVSKKMKKKDLEKQVEIAKNGDPNDFEDAFEKILKHMHNYLCNLTSEFFIQGSESQDVYQEGAIKLMNVIEKYDSTKGSFNSFAQSSIRKHIITKINKEKAQKRKILNTSYSLDNKTYDSEGNDTTYVENMTEETSPDITSSVGNPLDIVEKDYEEYIIDKICDNLSEMEKRVFILRMIKCYSYKEIAKELKLYKKDMKTEKMKLDSKSVDNAIWRSKPKIKKSLKDLGIHKKYQIKILDEYEEN